MKKLLIFLLVVVIIFGGVYLVFFRDTKSTEQSNLYASIRLISEGNLEPLNAVRNVEGQIYLSYDYIKEEIDPDVHFDEGEKTIIFTNEKSVKRYEIDSLKGTVNDVEVNLRAPIKYIDDTLMIPIEAFIYDYPIDMRYIEDKDLVIMDRTDTEYLYGTVVSDDAEMRNEPENDSPLIKSLNKGDEVVVFSDVGKWYKVRELNGVLGYVNKNSIELSTKFETFTRKIEKKETEEKSGENTKINMLWDFTTVPTQNGDNVESIVGVNVLSPTWFSVDEDLNIKDRSNIEYVIAAHKKDMKVWPMLDNTYSSKVSDKLLSKSSNRQKIIADLLKEYKRLGADGINVDFEAMNIESRDLFTQFVRELYPIFKENDMTVSVDVTPRIYSDVTKEPYNRKELARASDYVILMAYDQHWASSPEAGSVAEYKWVESNMNVLFRSIPMEKFVLGMPLYTRIWFDKDGKVTSQSVSMQKAKEYIRNNDMETVWDDTAKQYIAKKNIDGFDVSIWLEDKDSIREKTKLATKYNLAGVAGWRKGFETQDVWPAINENLK